MQAALVSELRRILGPAGVITDPTRSSSSISSGRSWKGVAVSRTARRVMGAMYLGLSALNWMSRGFITGGIYGRPLTIANVTHFVVGAIALIKAAIASQFMAEISLMAAIYSALAAWFGFVLLAHPSGGPGATR